MIISCPDCSAKYNIPDDKITPAGRKLKCKKCDLVWHFTPEGAEIQPQATPEPEIAAPIKQEPPKPKRSKKTLYFAIPALGLPLALLGALYFAPNFMTSNFPNTKAYYQSIGQFPIEVVEAKIGFTNTEINYNESYNTFNVTTNLKNLTDSIMKLPMSVEVIGLDAHQRPVQNWQFELASNYLEPYANVILSYDLNLLQF